MDNEVAGDAHEADGKIAQKNGVEDIAAVKFFWLARLAAGELVE